MGAGGRRGGVRAWRLRLRRAVHRDPSDRPAEHVDPPGDASVSWGAPGTETAGRGTGAVTGGATSGQDSLDQVLRRAAAARTERPDDVG
jgi:hypothetical protein